MKLQPFRKRIKSAKVNLEAVLNLSDQIQKYLSKTPDVNTAVNDFAMGIYAGFTNFYRNDNDEDTKGNEILDKVIKKLRALLKEYPDLELPVSEDPEEDSEDETENEDDTGSAEEPDEDKTDAEKIEESGLKWSDPASSLGIRWNSRLKASRCCRRSQDIKRVSFQTESEEALYLKMKAGAALLRKPVVRLESRNIGVLAVRSAKGSKLAFYRK